MKRTVITMILFVVCMSIGVRVSKGDDFAEMEKIVDLVKIKADSYTDFIQYAFWPKSEVFTARKCESRLIENDLQDLANTLARLICEEYLPTKDQMKSGVGIPKYLEGDDHLFLRYTTKSGVHVEVQDGRGLCILMSSPDWKKGELSQIGMFVKDIAIKTINFPRDSGIADNPTVVASTLEIGMSRCGALTWKLKGETTTSQSNWFSLIMWWSDGTRVLFAISKMSKEDYAELATVANPASLRKPRKFQYRGASVQSTKPTNVVTHPKESVLSDEMQKRHRCILNLRMIDALKAQWALDKGKKDGDPVIVSEIDAYDKARMPRVCPAGGTYTYNAVGVDPMCSFTTTNSDGMLIRHRFRGPD